MIVYNLGEVWARGIMYGDRVCEYLGTMEFRDEKNNLYGVIKFAPEVSSWFGWSKKKLPSDYFTGGIYEGDCADDTKKLCAADGTWLGCVEFDGIEYWNFEMDLEKFAMTKVAEPLPSDCRYREDIIYLHAEDIQGASEWKRNLEEKQRRDAKLRAAYQKARKKQDKADKKALKKSGQS